MAYFVASVCLTDIMSPWVARCRDGYFWNPSIILWSLLPCSENSIVQPRMGLTGIVEFHVCHSASDTTGSLSFANLYSPTRQSTSRVTSISVCGGNSNTGKRDHIQSRVTWSCDADAVFQPFGPPRPTGSPAVRLTYWLWLLDALVTYHPRVLSQTNRQRHFCQVSDYDCIYIQMRCNRKKVLT